MPTKPIARLTKLWLLLKKLSKLLTKPTSALCACWTKLAASNNPSGLLKADPATGRLFFVCFLRWLLA
ncbi:Major outer membrane lipoprotein [Pseudomonas cannabina]|uniref:Major outer membrane lipoprotein n=1 Tax=Pseudomonas cannabina TaxID=86840 RepID=A0A0N8QW21_PSECA|nr:Major outer membrane lipoprotein [Pseudomonas cannabina]